MNKIIKLKRRFKTRFHKNPPLAKPIYKNVEDYKFTRSVRRYCFLIIAYSNPIIHTHPVQRILGAKKTATTKNFRPHHITNPLGSFRFGDDVILRKLSSTTSNPPTRHARFSFRKKIKCPFE